MVRKDLIAGLKNAIERGYSLEQAKQSFITAGYNREDVEEAVQFMQSGSIIASPEIQMPASAVEPSKQRQIPEKQQAQKQILQTVVPKRKFNWKVIFLIIILMILIVIFILTLVFRDKIIALF